MSEPKRIQMRRTKGWRRPEGAIYVGRPSKWGNPFPTDGDWTMWTAIALGWRADPSGRRAAAVALHRAWLLAEPVALGPLAHAERDGGAIEFGDGTTVSLSDHCRGIAGFGASISTPPTSAPHPPTSRAARPRPSRWCPLDQPCHADVLLELANGG